MDAKNEAAKNEAAKNEVINLLRYRLDEVLALVDKLDKLDADDLSGAGLLFCDIAELVGSIADASTESASLCALGALQQRGLLHGDLLGELLS